MDRPHETVETILQRTLAYAAGLSESEITASTRINELGIDSISVTASAVVLEAELGVPVGAADVSRIFGAATLADAVALAREFVATAGGASP